MSGFERGRSFSFCRRERALFGPRRGRAAASLTEDLRRNLPSPLRAAIRSPSERRAALGRERADRAEAGDIRADEVERVRRIDAAERQRRDGGRRRQRLEAGRAERSGGMARRYEDRGEEDEIRPALGRQRQLISVMAGRRYDPDSGPRPRLPDEGARRDMRTGGSDGACEGLIRADQEHQPPAPADRGVALREDGSARIVVIAVDDRRSGRQGAENEFRFGNATPIRQEGEREWRLDAACAFERGGGRC